MARAWMDFLLHCSWCASDADFGITGKSRGCRIRHAGRGIMTSRDGLTPRQRQALTFIRSYQQRHGFPPSTRELAAHMGVVVSVGHWFIQKLIQKGTLRKTANTVRTLVVVETGQEPHSGK